MADPEKHEKLTQSTFNILLNTDFKKITQTWFAGLRLFQV